MSFFLMSDIQPALKGIIPVVYYHLQLLRATGLKNKRTSIGRSIHMYEWGWKHNICSCWNFHKVRIGRKLPAELSALTSCCTGTRLLASFSSQTDWSPLWDLIVDEITAEKERLQNKRRIVILVDQGITMKNFSVKEWIEHSIQWPPPS